MSELVKITEFNTLGKDDRGRTCEFSLPRKQDDYLFLTRKAGSLSGNTYHEGKGSATSPKIFLLISGSLKLTYRRIGDDKVNFQIISEPCTIEIQPMVTHKIEALTDITLLECNSISDIESDRKRENVELALS